MDLNDTLFALATCVWLKIGSELNYEKQGISFKGESSRSQPLQPPKLRVIIFDWEKTRDMETTQHELMLYGDPVYHQELLNEAAALLVAEPSYLKRYAIHACLKSVRRHLSLTWPAACPQKLLPFDRTITKGIYRFKATCLTTKALVRFTNTRMYGYIDDSSLNDSSSDKDLIEFRSEIQRAFDRHKRNIDQKYDEIEAFFHEAYEAFNTRAEEAWSLSADTTLTNDRAPSSEPT